MKKLLLFFYIISTALVVYPQTNPSGSNVLVLFHDTTYATSQAKRLADRDSLMQTINTLFTSVDVAMFDTSSNLSLLSSYQSVIIQETSFDVIQTRFLGFSGRNALKAWLNGGTAGNIRTLIFMGGDQGYNYSRTGSVAEDLPLAQDLLKFTYRVDNGTSAASGYSIEGVGIDAGNTRTMTNTPAGGGYWPDGASPLAGSTVLYKYSNRSASDTVAAVGVVETGYIGLSVFQDPRYFINGDFFVVLSELIQYAIANGGNFPGFVPVELTSFAASVVGANVNLSWITASELNNQGFEIERSTDSYQWDKIGFTEGKGTTTEMNYYSYSDSKLDEGTYYYRLKQLDFDGTFEYSSVVEATVTIPKVFSLEQNYPNPFNPSTKISFSLAADSKVMLKIYDILGQEVSTLFSGDLQAGEHEINFNASALNSGVYLYRINATGTNGTNFSSVKKMILSK